MSKEQLTIQDIKIDLKYKMIYKSLSLILLLFLFSFVLGISFFGVSLLEIYTEFLIVIFAPPAIVLAFMIVEIINIVKLYIVCSNKLCIVKDTLVGMDIVRGGRDYIRGIEFRLYFACFGRYKIVGTHYKHSKKLCMTKESVYNSSNSKDEFYIVLTKAHTGKIVMVYNDKFFEFNDKYID